MFRRTRSLIGVYGRIAGNQISYEAVFSSGLVAVLIKSVLFLRPARLTETNSSEQLALTTYFRRLVRNWVGQD